LTFQTVESFIDTGDSVGINIASVRDIVTVICCSTSIWP